MSNQTDGVDDLAALERFVIENDDLLELEQIIGRFNVFDALGVVTAEIKHSNFLAWLLDPGESHGQGDLFLRAWLLDLVRCAREQGIEPPIDAIDLDGSELRGIEVRREHERIDLLITGKEPAFVIAVENKLRAGEHGDQLARYQSWVNSAYPDARRMYVYLTLAGQTPSELGWVCYSAPQLHRVLSRTRRSFGSSIGNDVSVFLDHYLSLLDTRLMDNKNIESLCRKIYTNHRAAIDLIFRHVDSTSSPVLRAAQDALDARADRWQQVTTGRKTVDFYHRDLIGHAPRKRSDGSPGSWIYWTFNLWTEQTLSCNMCVFKCPDPEWRKRFLARVTRDRAEFGLKVSRKGMATDGWASLGRKPLYSWGSEEEPDAIKARQAMDAYLDHWERQLPKLIAVIHEAK